jgi:hypothetical protein
LLLQPARQSIQTTTFYLATVTWALPKTLARCRLMATEWAQFMASLRWLEAEGYIELFYDKDGNEMIRIAEGAENAKL